MILPASLATEGAPDPVAGQPSPFSFQFDDTGQVASTGNGLMNQSSIFSQNTTTAPKPAASSIESLYLSKIDLSDLLGMSAEPTAALPKSPIATPAAGIQPFPASKPEPVVDLKPTAPPQTATEEWEYLDPQQAVQGPFSSKDMRRWHHSGYFKVDLPIRVKGWSRFYPLGAVYPKQDSAFQQSIPEPAPVSTPSPAQLSDEAALRLQQILNSLAGLDQQRRQHSILLDQQRQQLMGVEQQRLAMAEQHRTLMINDQRQSQALLERQHMQQQTMLDQQRQQAMMDKQRMQQSMIDPRQQHMFIEQQRMDQQRQQQALLEHQRMEQQRLQVQLDHQRQQAIAEQQRFDQQRQQCIEEIQKLEQRMEQLRLQTQQIEDAHRSEQLRQKQQLMQLQQQQLEEAQKLELIRQQQAREQAAAAAEEAQRVKLQELVQAQALEASKLAVVQAAPPIKSSQRRPAEISTEDEKPVHSKQGKSHTSSQAPPSSGPPQQQMSLKLKSLLGLSASPAPTSSQQPTPTAPWSGEKPAATGSHGKSLKQIQQEEQQEAQKQQQLLIQQQQQLQKRLQQQKLDDDMSEKHSLAHATWAAKGSAKPAKAAPSLKDIMKEEVVTAPESAGSGKQGSNSWAAKLGGPTVSNSKGASKVKAVESQVADSSDKRTKSKASSGVGPTESAASKVGKSEFGGKAGGEFGGKGMPPDLEEFCVASMQKIHGNDDITLLQFCMTLKSPVDVREYLAAYLGSKPEVRHILSTAPCLRNHLFLNYLVAPSSPQVSQFASEFIKRRDLKETSATPAPPVSAPPAPSPRSSPAPTNPFALLEEKEKKPAGKRRRPRAAAAATADQNSAAP